MIPRHRTFLSFRVTALRVVRRRLDGSLFIPQGHDRKSIRLYKRLHRLQAILLRYLRPFSRINVRMINISRSNISFNRVPFRLVEHFKIASPIVIQFSNTTIVVRRLLVPLNRGRVYTFIGLKARSVEFTIPTVILVHVINVHTVSLMFHNIPIRALRFHHFGMAVRLCRLLNRLTSNLRQFQRLRRIQFPIVHRRIRGLRMPYVRKFRIHKRFLRRRVGQPITKMRFRHHFSRTMRNIQLTMMTSSSRQLIQPRRTIHTTRHLSSTFMISSLIRVRHVRPF